MAITTIEKSDLANPNNSHLKKNKLDITQTVAESLNIVTGAEDDQITVKQVTGNVSIETGAGNDDIRIREVSGDLNIHAGTGNDKVTIHTLIGGHVSVYGEEGDDTLIGGPSQDHLYGGSGDDTIKGNRGNDIVEGGDNTGHFNIHPNKVQITRGDHLWGRETALPGDQESNTFIFRNGNGVQTIHDYHTGQDQPIEVHGYNAQTTEFFYKGNDTFIKFNDTAGILVLNAQLNAAHVEWVRPILELKTTPPLPIIEQIDASHQSIALNGKFFASEKDSGDPSIDNELILSIIGPPLLHLDGALFSSPQLTETLSNPNAFSFTEITSNIKKIKVRYEYNVDSVDLDFLTVDQVLTISYPLVATSYMADSLITDLTFTIIGTNDLPIITGTKTGAVTEDNGLNAITQVSGALIIADLDAGESFFQVPAPTFDSMNECTYTLKTVPPFDTGTMIFDNNTQTFKENTMANMISRADLTAESTDVVGSYGTFNFDTTGAWVYTLDNSTGSATDQLRAGQVVHDTLVVVSFDGTTSKTIDITVTGTNDLPVIGGDVTGSIVEGDGIAVNTISGTVTIADPDAGENSFVTLGNLVANYGVFTFDNSTGAWTYTVNDTAGTAVDHLKAGEVIFDQLNVGSVDGSTPFTIEVTITGTNDVPVISGVNTGAVKEDNAPDAVTTASGALSIVDADSGENSFLVPENLEGVYGTFSVATDGSWGYLLNNASGSLTDQLQEGEVVHDFLTVTSFDGSASTVIDITVTGTNDIPLIAGLDVGTVVEDNVEGAITTVSGSLTIADPDHDESSFELPVPLVFSEVLPDQGPFNHVTADHFCAHSDVATQFASFGLALDQTELVL